MVEFSRSEKKIGVSGTTILGLVVVEGLIKKKAPGSQGLSDVREQSPMQIAKHQDDIIGVDSQRRRWVCFKIDDLQRSSELVLGKLLRDGGEGLFIAISKCDLITLLAEPQTIASMSASKVEGS